MKYSDNTKRNTKPTVNTYASIMIIEVDQVSTNPRSPQIKVRCVHHCKEHKTKAPYGVPSRKFRVNVIKHYCPWSFSKSHPVPHSRLVEVISWPEVGGESIGDEEGGGDDENCPEEYFVA